MYDPTTDQFPNYAGSGAPVRWLSRAVGLAAALGLIAFAPATAQVGPSTAEIARYTGLHAAAHQGDLTTMTRLVAASTHRPADLQARDGNGRTPIHVAAFARQPDAIRALAKAGANLELLENDRYDAVTIAAVADDEETLRTLLALGASAKLTTSVYDGTALIAAAHLGHDGVVRQLIAAGAPLDHVNNLHWTAVIESIILGSGGPRHQETLRALLAAGANTRLTDRSGNTPLQLAKARGYQEMVQLLERHGANEARVWHPHPTQTPRRSCGRQVNTASRARTCACRPAIGRHRHRTSDPCR